MKKMQKKYFQITEAAHACGISRSTLMRMEEKGLLTPAYIAEESGRRYYDNHDVARVLQIEKFKSMGLVPGRLPIILRTAAKRRRCWRYWRIVCMTCNAV